MSRFWIALILVLCCLPSGVAAPDPIAAAQEKALALIDFPWKQLEYEIVFLPARRGFRAMTIQKERRIEIYVRPADDTGLLAYDIAHELGHAIDFSHNTHEIRRKWMELRGIDSATPWFGCNRCTDYSTPAGDFAETFALLLLGPEHFSSRIAPKPTQEQIPALMPFFLKTFFQK